MTEHDQHIFGTIDDCDARAKSLRRASASAASAIARAGRSERMRCVTMPASASSMSRVVLRPGFEREVTASRDLQAARDSREHARHFVERGRGLRSVVRSKRSQQ